MNYIKFYIIQHYFLIHLSSSFYILLINIKFLYTLLFYFDIIIKSFKGVNMKKFFIILAKIFLIILEIIINILGFLGACLILFNIIRGW